MIFKTTNLLKVHKNANFTITILKPVTLSEQLRGPLTVVIPLLFGSGAGFYKLWKRYKHGKETDLAY